MHHVPVIHLESEYHAEVIWFPGPIPYDDTHLSPALIDDLQWWHRRTEGTTTHLDHFGPFGRPMSLVDAGRSLAQRLADEVGGGFEVELWCEGSHGRFRSRRPATRPDAARFFASRIAES